MSTTLVRADFFLYLLLIVFKNDVHRTAYLDKALTTVINTIMNDHNNATSTTTTQQQRRKKKIRLLVMGGGYDTRSIKLLEQSLLMQRKDDDTTTSSLDNLLRRRHNQSQRRKTRWYNRLLRRNNNSYSNNNNNNNYDTLVQNPTNGNAFCNITSTNYNLEAYELDLPEVVSAKQKLLSSRLYRRRPWLRRSQQIKTMMDEEYPNLCEANFNDLNATRKVLEGILLHDNDDAESGDDVTNIILFEGVMIYLDYGVPHALLELCSDVLRKGLLGCNTNNNSSSTRRLGYLCFADRLENIPGGDEDAAHVEMESTGWELMDFLSKPGLARHMGVARVVE